MPFSVDIYLLPGLDGTGRLFDPLISAAPDWSNPKVIRYDPNVSRSYAELVSDVSAQIDSSKPFVVVGESFSGPVAVLSALNHQNSNLLGVVFCASFIRNPYRSLALSPKFALRMAIILARPLRAVNHFLGVGDDPDLQESAGKAISEVSQEVVFHRVWEIRNVDVSKEPQQLSCPVLYLKANRDRVMPERARRDVMQVKPSALTVEIDTSHLLLQTKPTECWQAMANLIEETAVSE